MYKINEPQCFIKIFEDMCGKEEETDLDYKSSKGRNCILFFIAY